MDEIRPRYSRGGMDGVSNGGTCQGSVSQAIVCALDAHSFENAIRNAVSIGGDSDTIACITGSIAEASYGVSQNMREQGLGYLPEELKEMEERFEEKYGAGDECAG